MQYVVKEGEGGETGRDDRVGCCCCCCEREGGREGERLAENLREGEGVITRLSEWRGRGDGELERRRRGEQKYLRGTFFLVSQNPPLET